MKKGIMILVLALCITALALINASADDGCRYGKCPMSYKGGGAMSMRKCMKMDDKVGLDEKFYRKAIFLLMNSEELGLKDDQKEKIHALKISVKKSMTLKDAQIDVLKIDIKEALSKDSPDMDAVNSLIDKKYELKKEAAKEVALAYTQLCNVLTKEQKEKAKQAWHKGMICKFKKMAE